MQQLSGLDAAFLALDTSHTTGHVGGVHLLDGRPEAGEPKLTLERLTALVGARLHLVPVLRRRVVQVPFGLGQPFWVEDPDFDLEFHIRELALPRPGSMQQLTAQVARIHARPLDHSRPLWELYLLHGLKGGRLALYGKLHHAMIDGVAGQEVTAALMDPSPRGRRLPPAAQWVPDELPGGAQLLARTVLSLGAQPRRAARLGADLVRSAPGVLGLVAASLPGRRVRLRSEDGALLSGRGLLAPATPFNRAVGPHRRVALRTVPFDAVHAVKAASGLTVNDVVLAMCAGALRRWLELHAALPAEPLVAAVPVSVRDPQAPGDGDVPGNKVSLMLAGLPTHLGDPLDRLQAVHEATLRAKLQHDALPADLLADVYAFTMPALVGLATRANARLRLLERVKLFNLFISNVPGPQVPLYVGGHVLLASYPVSAITDGQGLNITVVSYAGGLHLGLISDRELISDLDVLADYLAEELELLARATGASVEE
jgi:WS/DGAT/MGAT family acyltransferase